tara:strand:- start:585 stop:2165 length:1581 start_codon:yes stop_codon:yes gene_type:complete
MEITEQQFTANLEQMPEQQQVQVVQLIEQNDSKILQSFAASLGVNLSMGEEEAPLDSSEEVGGEPPLLPRERNLQEMQQFDNRMDPDPDPDPDVSDPAAFPGQVTAPGAREVEASPVQDQMQQLAFGDQVAGPIEQPGAENETGVADDVPMDAPEGAFIINASAIAKVGRLDFEQRILAPAIKELKKEGVNIELASLKTPSKQVDGAVDIAVSNKEYYIPPELAEMIGTDLLEKINKRGEKETEEKLAEQPPQQEVAPAGQNQIPVRGAKGINGLALGDQVVDPKESAKKKLRIRENAPLERSTGKLFSKAQYNKKADGKREGFRTIGFGHAIQDLGKSVQRFQKLFNVNRATAVNIASGKERITKDQALKLFDSDYTIKEDDVISRVSGKDVYTSLPSEVQEIFVDANFRGDFQKNNKNYKWVEQAIKGDYLTASQEVLDHQEAKANPKGGVAKRIQDYSKVLRSLSPNNSSPEGRTPLALEKQQSFMSQNNETRVSPISEAELQELEKRSDTTTYLTKQQPPVN